ncbi:hypothetical protein [Alkalimonas sp.]|uniref:hypothetical protein n=1 Tax=Alkalimonas sp. TaxID=1872453 RepID=UPI00263AFD77|nr:hypothetical protein [Alkalimonas sp.]MCC5825734.1 hypothetical protein [Alkalimonas sp.]
MKALMEVQDYLFSPRDVGDWDGEEEQVADQMNAIYHAVWSVIPDDTATGEVELLLSQLWQQLSADSLVLEASEEELIDWSIAFVENQLAADPEPSDEDEDDEYEE